MVQMFEEIGGGFLRVDIAAVIILGGIVVSLAAGRIWGNARAFLRVFRHGLIGIEWVLGFCCCLAGILDSDTCCLFRGTFIFMGIFPLIVLDSGHGSDASYMRKAMRVEVYVPGVAEPVEVIDGVIRISDSDGISELVVRAEGGRIERRYMTHNFLIKEIKETKDGV